MNQPTMSSLKKAQEHARQIRETIAKTQAVLDEMKAERQQAREREERIRDAQNQLRDTRKGR